MRSHLARVAARLLALPSVLAVLASCTDGTGLEPEETSSFVLLQSRIFNPHCVPCHNPGNHFGIDSGLFLQGGASYGNLVGATPRNAQARAEGLALVHPGQPERSLLYLKLLWGSDSRAGSYGSAMPLGGPPLTVGEVEFVRRWILAGAPLVGAVADPSLLDAPTP